MRIDQSLMALERHITRRWREEGDPSGISLTYTEYDYLQTLEEAGTRRLSDLAQVMGVSKPTASNMVKRLERKALVRRQGCAEDGRAVILSLTEQGQQLLAQDRRLYRQLVDELLAHLGEAERAQLAGLLARLVRR
ncbi:MarR family winged helix-turn-helix transcriptional regulator [Ferrimonas balearica]|uniref:MarR family winged helix-turn-helix transcriptional regulator n=1 Tax=Ferrimonas balearica TaxID=44012 RepID=UPI001C98F82B|nr:MarR family transcriptional regulator [Ferrimonas balearica]MBY5992553.1 MarR family transcriptional regulator [Ferrimonas balearica]